MFYNLFVRNLRIFVTRQKVWSGKPFHPSLLLASKAVADPSEVPFRVRYLSGSLLYGRLLPYPQPLD